MTSTCRQCQGRGTIAVAYWEMERGAYNVEEPCPTCRPADAAAQPTATERARAEDGAA